MNGRQERDMMWKDAIAEVLRGVGEPMHYTDIAQEVVERGLRTSVGATPAATVAAQMSMDIVNEGADSQFVRVDRGVYTLRRFLEQEAAVTPTPTPTTSGAEEDMEEQEAAGLINAFGMYWRRAAVEWSSNPCLWGKQQQGADPVNFSAQRGVYLLHDGDRTVYVGRTTDQSLGRRLYQHTTDRLNGRWDRWSWFGLLEVTDTGELREPGTVQRDTDAFIATMEALLIESLEPGQNRKRGDDFRAVEYMQAEDPEEEHRKLVQLMDALRAQL